jgi:hypothetical protein
MSVSKFRFVSPGVQTAEIDNSQLPKLPEEIGPVIIGRSLRGPMMRPVRVESFSDFVDVFGEPVAGGAGGDIWRDGNKTTPTYGAYAAQAYLKNSSPVTFIRLGGFEHDEATTGLAGWETNYAYGLFFANAVSGASGWVVSGSAALGAIIYTSGTAGLVGSGLNQLTTDSVVNKEATWVRIDNIGLETRIVLNGTTSSINFDEDSKKYLRKVLNTNPTAYADNDYFLGESFVTWLTDSGLSLDVDKNDASSAAAILLRLSGYQNQKQGALDAESGWIVSQHLGVTSSFTADASGSYGELQNLFKFVGLSEGEWNSQNLKVSIEDIKAPLNEYVKYGTFTVSVRKMGDSDLRPEYVERFSGLNLDPSSDNYIAKRIGDKYTEWNYTQQSYVEYGTYDNKSKFIRVEMDADVDDAKTNPNLLPFGFYGPIMYANQTVTGSGTAGTALTSVLAGNNITGALAYTASFAMPQMPLLSNSSVSTVTSFSSMYWGAQTNLDNSRKLNKDFQDFLRASPATFTATKTQFLFSLDDISGAISAGEVVESAGASWAEGNRSSGVSITAQAGTDALLAKFNKFTVPLMGGTDGVDITQRDPFANSILGTGTQYTNYAYNSVKVAIESMADPEVVETNLAVMPGITVNGLNSMLIEKCELRGDALAIVDLEGDYNPETKVKPDVDAVITEIDNYANTSYGCAFFPWVLVKDTINNNKIWMPPSVVALGTFSSSQKKTELWFAPAGFNRGGLSDGAAGLPVLQTSLPLKSTRRDDLYEKNINPIASFPQEGIVVMGQKTLQVTPSALDRINVRRLMIYLKKEISRMASTVLFDPNVEVTWKRFLDKANPFLASVQSRFGLSEYRVILDETTTTPDLIDRNVVYAKIMVKPARAIEFIALDFVITNTGASFND